MPIKGLTTQGGESFPEIGKLRKGGQRRKRKNKDGKEYEIFGEELTYFRFDSKDPSAIAAFKNAYGAGPTEVKCFLPSDDVDTAFFTCKEEWSAGGLKRRCDGENLLVLQLSDGRYQRQFAAPVPCIEDCQCKEVGRLKVILRGLNRFAYVTAETHSINDIVNIHKQLSAAKMTFGQLTNIPFVLRRVPMEISTPTNDGKRARREKWMLSIEVDPTWAEPRLAAMDAIALQEARMEQVSALPPQQPGFALPAAQPEPLSYADTQAWQTFSTFLQRSHHEADPATAVEALRSWAYRKVGDHSLPERARGAIDQECDRALDQIKIRNGAPLPTPASNAPVKPEVLS